MVQHTLGDIQYSTGHIGHKLACCRSESTDVNSMASESSSAASVEESISQTAELNLASSSCAETDVKDSAASSSEAAKKTEIPMPSGPKTRQALEFEISKLTNYFLSYM